MLLPTRLEQTTLGDLLGLMYRERLSGVLELVDERGIKHRVGLDDGEVCTVETPWGPRLGELLIRRLGSALTRPIELQLWQANGKRLGEALVAGGALSEAELTVVLTEQSRLRLEALFALGSARVVFRPARGDREVTPLSATEYLPGRARKRSAEVKAEHDPRAVDDGDPWAVLGVRPGAAAAEVRAAFRKRAQQLHPDANLHRSQRDRARTTQQFLRLSAAYRKLVA